MATMTASTGGTPSRHVDPTRRAQAVAAWVLALPFVLLFLAFTAGPVLASLGMSFTDFRRADIRSPFAVEFLGLSNYVDLVQDPVFRKVTLNTLLYLVLGVPLTMAVALAAAVGINRLNRFKGLFRVGFYLPVVTSIVAVSVVWKFLYRHHGGLFNTVLGWVGIGEVNWLDNTALALPSLVVMAAWRNFGTLMVIFLAGLQTIPREVTEAAEVDGAGGWAHFRHITLPMLRPTLLFGAVITGIGYLQFFEEAFVMTQGGPLDSTRSVTYFTYDQFRFGNFGYAAAASYLLFLAIVLLTYLQFRWLGERDERADTRPRRPRRPRGRRHDRRAPRSEDHRSTTRATTDRSSAAGRGNGRRLGADAAVAVRRAHARAGRRGRAVRLDAALVVQAGGRGPRAPADVVAGDA